MKREIGGNGSWFDVMRFVISLLLATAPSASSLIPSLDQTPRQQYAMMLDVGHRRLGESDVPNGRHSSPPPRKRVSEEEELSRFSYYMTNECRPRASGYFGSTGGEPLVFQYGFELETTLFATRDKILNILSDRIMDQMLSSIFSDMCGLRRRRELGTVGDPPSEGAGTTPSIVTGFKFNSEQIVPSSKCYFRCFRDAGDRVVS
jgi:hypothetical protein